jgi:tetratricopeptide (TPR) repeat protein
MFPRDLEALVPSSGLSRAEDRPETILLELALAYIDSVAGQLSVGDTSHQHLSTNLVGRLQVSTPIREYVQYKHVLEEGDYERLRRHYLDIATGQGRSTLLRRFTPEVHNSEVVTVHSLSIPSEQEQTVYSATALCTLWEFSGVLLPDLVKGLREVLPTLRNIELTAIVQHTLGRVALTLSKYDEARARFEEAIPLHEEIGDSHGKAQCIYRLGNVAWLQSKGDEARARFEEATPLYEEVSDRQGKAHCIRGLGDVARLQSKYDEARARFEDAIRLYEEVCDRQGKAHCIHSGRFSKAVAQRISPTCCPRSNPTYCISVDMAVRRAFFSWGMMTGPWRWTKKRWRTCWDRHTATGICEESSSMRATAQTRPTSSRMP